MTSTTVVNTMTHDYLLLHNHWFEDSYLWEAFGGLQGFLSHVRKVESTIIYYHQVLARLEAYASVRLQTVSDFNITI